MLALSRFTLGQDGPAGVEFLDRARAALAVLARCPGYRGGRIARSVDEPTQWVLVTEWDGIGAYRRALSSYDVRVQAAQLLGESLDEPAAYEELVTDAGEQPSDRVADGTRDAGGRRR